MARYDIDTVSDDNTWVVLRRVNFYVSDLIAHRLHKMHIGSTDRCVLDTLDYSRASGMEAVTSSTLCALVPAVIKPATAASALKRLQERGWVSETTDPGVGRGPNAKYWHLTDEGKQTRQSYGHEVELIIRQMYSDMDESTHSRLFEYVGAAVDYMHERMLPILEFEGRGERSRPPTSTPWSSLRRVHFYLNDLILRETQPVGVGGPERRVLDALGYARKEGIEEGLNTSTICRLNEALSRQAAETALGHMLDREWIRRDLVSTHAGSGRPRPRWRLAPKGERIREIYKRYAQLKLREVYEIGPEAAADLLPFVQAAHAQRSARLGPVLAHYQRSLLPKSA